MTTTEKNALGLLTRYLAYVILLFVQYLLLTFVILPKNWSFAENGIIEWLQFSMLVVLIFMMAVNASIFSRWRKIFLLLFSCAVLAMARELDKILDEWIPLFGWQAVFLLVIPLILLQFRNIQELRRQLPPFILSPAMGFFLTAIIVIIPLAQCIGDGEYLRAAMEEGYIRKYKTLFEESLELYGYLLLLCGAFESTLWAWQNQKTFRKRETALKDP